MIGTVKLYACAGALAAFLALLVFAHHTIYASGEKAQLARDQKPIAAAKAAQKVAETERDQYITALNEANQAAQAEQNKAKAQAQRAAAAVAASQANAQDADRTLKAWMDKYARAARDPDCAKTLQDQLCAAASDY
ncbi:hypothetical protein [Dokdonella soli]|uniref:DUF2514 family protein n=1 Tax=Dokdonella soli TaxID=529810 RepID=A0ABN1IU48_9GAMM